MTELKPWPKIARLFRDIVITEKIDGTNGAIGIADDELLAKWDGGVQLGDAITASHSDYNGTLLVYAQSRSRIITPKEDNHGFAKWVWDNADALVQVLGPGLHYGEWWGSGINRGYGLPKGEKRFSLFNTKRWSGEILREHGLPGLHVVPVLYTGPFSTVAVQGVKADLLAHGSYASPGFMNPEGVVVYHTAGNVMFKSTLENDELPKEVVKNRMMKAA